MYAYLVVALVLLGSLAYLGVPTGGGGEILQQGLLTVALTATVVLLSLPTVLLMVRDDL